MQRFQEGDQVRLLKVASACDSEDTLFEVEAGTVGKVFRVQKIGPGPQGPFLYEVDVPCPDSPDGSLWLVYDARDCDQIEKVTP